MRGMDWRSLTDAQVSYLLDAIEITHWEIGQWVSLK